jgi:hypothetical protein
MEKTMRCLAAKALFQAAAIAAMASTALAQDAPVPWTRRRLPRGLDSRSRGAAAAVAQPRQRDLDDNRHRAGAADDVPGLALFYGGLVRAKNMLSF